MHALPTRPAPRRFRLPDAQQALLASEYANMQACIRCGLCLQACPTYLISMAEEEGPRGRVAIARALAEGHLDLTPDLLEHQNNCLLCEACTRVCPAGVRMEELGVPLRQVFEDLRPRPWWQRHGRRLVFRHLFGSLPKFRRVAAFLRLYQRSGLQRLIHASGALRLVGLERMERYLPPIDREFLVPRGQTWGSRVGSQMSGVALDLPTPAVGLFVGCIMSTAFAETDRATARLLARAGYRVTATTGQGCCGALNAHCGDREGARALARRNVEAFEHDPEAPIAVNAAGCGAMLKEYGHLLRDDASYAERAAAFSARVRDATELLAARVGAGLALPARAGQAPPLPVTYQDACHLAHAQGITRQPRELLRAAGFDVVEMKESSVCCGSAGVYNVLHPDKAGQLLERKLDHALATGAPTIVTANPGCLLQLRAGLAERGSDVRVRHIVDVLAEASSARSRSDRSFDPHTVGVT